MSTDLILLGISGVQRFITESRTTADVVNASRIIQRLAATAARTAQQKLTEPHRLIYPVLTNSSDPEGVTSKVAFLTEKGKGADIAQESADAARQAWQDMVTGCYGTALDTPGMPDLWWVSVTGDVGTDEDYRKLWRQASDLAVARRRSRFFEPVYSEQTWLCTQSPRLPSAPVPSEPRKHERRERLSAAGWVKRTIGRSPNALAVRSTPSIASASFRAALLTAPPEGLAGPVGRLAKAAARVTSPVIERPVVDNAVPEELAALNDRLGAWVHPEVWEVESLRREYRSGVDEQLVDEGRSAARDIVNLAEEAGSSAPTPYFAIVLQDLDRLGRAMSQLGLDDQRAASEQLVELAAAQREEVESQRHLGIAVYAGGDDLLAFCPAATAITLARTLRELVDTHLGAGPLATAGEDGRPVTASTAVLFAHMSSPLQTAIASARSALDEAKNAHLPGEQNRNALGIVVLRRGGERARSVQPWHIPATDTAAATDPVTLLETLRPARSALSPGLAAQFERDEPELGQLATKPALHTTLHAEITRLLKRRGGEPEHADALHRLAWHERSRRAERGTSARYRPVAPLLVARFLTQKCG